MGYYLKEKNGTLFHYRGKLVERKTQATYYANKYSAETMLIRWRKKNPKNPLVMCNWVTDEIKD